MNKWVDKILIIIDMENVGMVDIMGKKLQLLVELLLEITQKFFPEILHKIFIINAGMIFRVAWKLIWPCVDKHVLEKIEILGGDYIKKLKLFIDEEKIPKSINGKCEDLLPTNPGMWYEEFQLSV